MSGAKGLDKFLRKSLFLDDPVEEFDGCLRRLALGRALETAGSSRRGWELWWEGFEVGEEYWEPKLQEAAATGN
jgi:hypothetical protein